MAPFADHMGTFSLTVYNVPAPVAKNMAAEYQRTVDPSLWVDTSWMPNSLEADGDVETLEGPTFRQELQALINKHSVENPSNTPDWILMEYLMKSLDAWELATHLREEHYGRTN